MSRCRVMRQVRKCVRECESIDRLPICYAAHQRSIKLSAVLWSLSHQCCGIRIFSPLSLGSDRSGAQLPNCQPYANYPFRLNFRAKTHVNAFEDSSCGRT